MPIGNSGNKEIHVIIKGTNGDDSRRVTFSDYYPLRLGEARATATAITASGLQAPLEITVRQEIVPGAPPMMG